MKVSGWGIRDWLFIEVCYLFQCQGGLVWKKMIFLWEKIKYMFGGGKGGGLSGIKNEIDIIIYYLLGFKVLEQAQRYIIFSFVVQILFILNVFSSFFYFIKYDYIYIFFFDQFVVRLLLLLSVKLIFKVS